ncbi:MAG: hypothetical protein PHD83_06160 [Caldisericia bacterium]|nr:hypothetical protein [Caldisericia bacterium]
MEENKTQTAPQAKSRSRAVLKFLFGFIFLAAGIALWWIYRENFWGLFLACIGPFLALVGIIILAIAKE